MVSLSPPLGLSNAECMLASRLNVYITFVYSHYPVPQSSTVFLNSHSSSLHLIRASTRAAEHIFQGFGRRMNSNQSKRTEQGELYLHRSY